MPGGRAAAHVIDQGLPWGDTLPNCWHGGMAMCVEWPARRSFRALMVPLVMAAALVGLGPHTASVSACGGWTIVKPPSPGSGFNTLAGVAATSATDAWAVG